MKQISFLSIVLGTALCFLLSACNPGGSEPTPQGGTDTPNPKSQGQNTGTQIASTLCARLSHCRTGVSEGLCRNRVLALGNLTNHFGDAGDFPSLNAVDKADGTASLAVNSTALTQCLSSIQDLACGSDEIGAAWSADAPNDFGQIAHMIPTRDGSCARVIESHLR